MRMDYCLNSLILRVFCDGRLEGRQKGVLRYKQKIIEEMFESLKQMAIQQLMAKMASNALGANETKEAATEGASGIMDILQSKIAGGKVDEVKDLFSGGNMEENGIFAEAKAKMSETLQAKGMSAEDADQEAANTTPDVLNSLKDKFASKDEADSGFNLESLTSLIPGGAGDLLKNVAGGNAGDLLNQAKNLFGK